MPIVKSDGLGSVQPHTVTMSTLDGGFSSGEQTTALIKKIANEYKTDPQIRYLTVRIVSQCPSHNYLAELKCVFEWVRDNVRYVRDIESCETLQIPQITLPREYSPVLGVGAGDCDDHSLLLATMLKSIGFRDIYARIVTFRPSDKEWKHIYLIVKHNGQTYSLDAICKDKPFNYECKYYSKKDILL